MIIIQNGNSLDLLKLREENSIDSCVTDPPYGLVSIVKRFSKTSINDDTQTSEDARERKTPFSRTSRGFMGNEWDGSGIEYNVDLWKEVYRVLKPGAFLLAFGGTRTYHRVTCAIEDAGFEIRDCMMWLYGSGFPKSLDISKQIDKIELGIHRGKAGKVLSENGSMSGGNYERTDKGEPVSDNAKKWNGWGTALKPAWEPIILARKPISEKNVALNVLKWGVGGINIDESRIDLDGEIVPINKLEEWSGFGQVERPDYVQEINTAGRWPSNLLLDDESSKIVNEQKDGVARFFYCAKVAKKEKVGIEHPTMKPVKLMEYLVRLVTPKNGKVLDPFMGSGSTGVACKNLDYSFVGMDIDPKNCDAALKRINDAKEKED